MKTNHSIGHQAEKNAADYLKGLGYEIVELNWKTKYCEIDIIARKDDVINFIEVKHRKNSNQGHGFDYITPKKLKQMEFAARFWLSENSTESLCILAALSSSPDGFELIELGF
jgi:Holliday junction resolvase-like predicted endonuclease